MTNYYADTQDILHSASSTLADGTAAVADLATNAVHSAAAWAEKAPGQAKDIWDDVVSNFDDVVYPARSRKRRKRTWLICAAATVAVAVGIAVIIQRRNATASEAGPATAAEASAE